MGRNTNDLEIFIKTKDLILYTFNVTESKKFPKKARFVFVNRIQNLVLDIYQELLIINELDIRSRIPRLIHVLSKIKALLFLIELCFRQKYINSHTCEVWVKQCVYIKNLGAGWLKWCKETIK